MGGFEGLFILFLFQDEKEKQVYFLRCSSSLLCSIIHTYMNIYIYTRCLLILMCCTLNLLPRYAWFFFLLSAPCFHLLSKPLLRTPYPIPHQPGSFPLPFLKMLYQFDSCEEKEQMIAGFDTANNQKNVPYVSGPSLPTLLCHREVLHFIHL